MGWDGKGRDGKQEHRTNRTNITNSKIANIPIFAIAKDHQGKGKTFTKTFDKYSC